jgi:hypothetical protein
LHCSFTCCFSFKISSFWIFCASFSCSTAFNLFVRSVMLDPDVWNYIFNA